MRFMFHSMGRYRGRITGTMALKFLAGIAELMLPYILEHLIDDIVPTGEMRLVILWGSIMILSAGICAFLNITSNRFACNNAHLVTYDVRQELFEKTANLSGSQVDHFGLPSLTSRMTSDSYNVQGFVQAFQTICVRAPFILAGGIIVTMTLDPVLSAILCAMLPPLFLIVFTVSRKGIPLFNKVQVSLDKVVRIMRENITGIRVVKALTKSEYEKARFSDANEDMMKTNIRASRLMAIPGPTMQIFLNTGLVIVVLVGAHRVDSGLMKPGVILAFLTYFNMILFSVGALNRIFMMMSKATASADRIREVMEVEDDQPVLGPDEAKQPSGEGFIRFEHVNFRYRKREGVTGIFTDVSAGDSRDAEYGGEQENCLTDMDFTIRRGESLGIIGPTGCGKSTILNLLMRFYDVEDGGVFVDGKDVRSYEKDDLRRRFGVVFQNDTIFNQTLRENIAFGRCVEEADIWQATDDAMVGGYLRELEEGLDYMADIKGANLSGGQKQRLLISRALVGKPEILILDDSSSALDYKTDAALRGAISRNYEGVTTIMVAQRVSSLQNMTHILVMEDGKTIGYGTHEELLATCPYYRDVFESQMGSLA